MRLGMVVISVVLGVASSWEIVALGQSSPIAIATSSLAGLFPLLYMAIGIDERIAYYRGIAGKYRVLQARFQDLVRTASRFSDEALAAEYEVTFAEYCRVREEAHTVPGWCYREARRQIDRGDYALLESRSKERMKGTQTTP